jgi:transcription antitermination factor NusG
VTESNSTPVVSTRVPDASTRSYAQSELPENDSLHTYHWYPMYVKYRKELSVQTALNAKQFRTFIPMKERIYKQGNRVVSEFEPAIHNLIFVYSFRERISWMKMYNSDCLPLQYMSHRLLDGTSEVITIPDSVMENFIRAATVDDPQGQRSYHDRPVSISDVDRHIRFVAGSFKGVEGVIKRVEKNRAMVIPFIDGLNLRITITHASDFEFLHQ